MAGNQKSVIERAKPVEGKGKADALASALKKIEKDFGKGSVMKLGEKTNTKIESRSTGSISLDLALGYPLPHGRIIEMFGPESSGKTTFALHAIVEVQKNGGFVHLLMLNMR